MQKVLEEIKTIYGLEYTNPITNKKKFEVLQLNEIQLKIQNIIDLELGWPIDEVRKHSKE